MVLEMKKLWKMTFELKKQSIIISIEISTCIVHLVCVHGTTEVSKCRKCWWEGREYIRFPRTILGRESKGWMIALLRVARFDRAECTTHIPRMYRWDMFLVFNR